MTKSQTEGKKEKKCQIDLIWRRDCRDLIVKSIILNDPAGKHFELNINRELLKLAEDRLNEKIRNVLLEKLDGKIL